LTVVGLVGWALSTGVVSAIIAVGGGHEMLHRKTFIEQLASHVFIASILYGGSKVIHVKLHHVIANTPEDPQTAAYNQSVYAFLPRAYANNFRPAWRVERERLEKLGYGAWNWRNHVLQMDAMSCIILAAVGYAFGPLGIVMYIGQAFTAVTVVEIVNYIQHYGLARVKLADGTYERQGPQHSWSCYYRLSNYLLLQAQRHSDHHVHPGRRYQEMVSFEGNPELPAAYPVMLLLALIPGAWRRVMNPRLAALGVGPGGAVAPVLNGSYPVAR
jgi:alkane 1-monooxygenase